MCFSEFAFLITGFLCIGFQTIDFMLICLFKKNKVFCELLIWLELW